MLISSALDSLTFYNLCSLLLPLTDAFTGPLSRMLSEALGRLIPVSLWKGAGRAAGMWPVPGAVADQFLLFIGTPTALATQLLALNSVEKNDLVNTQATVQCRSLIAFPITRSTQIS